MVKNKKPKKSPIRTVLKYLVRAKLLFIAILLLSWISTQAPDIHQKGLIALVSRSVVMVTPPGNNQSGGTGFQIETASGPKIVTNGHVCEGLRSPYAQINKDGKIWMRRVLKISQYTDLCLIDGVKKLSSLKLGEERERFDLVQIIGHPWLQPLTPAVGRVLARRPIEIIVPRSKDKCVGKTYEWKRVITWFGPASVCMRTVNSVMTNAAIYPGNSGSPVVNFWGRVVGVAFAGNFMIRVSYYVPVSALRLFLKRYELEQNLDTLQ